MFAAGRGPGGRLLAGWTKKGTRPYFKVATGLSTGAPLTIAGPKYDDLMKKLYTTLRTKDIIRVRSAPRISEPRGDVMNTVQPGNLADVLPRLDLVELGI